MAKEIKAKYKIGKLMWYLKNGSLYGQKIRAVFLDKWGSMKYAFDVPMWSSVDDCYKFPDKDVKDEDEIYPSKAALIAFIEEQDDDEENDD